MYYMFMEKNQIIINNQLISYVGTQSTGDKCLLFLHGWGSSKEVWGEVSKLISQSVNQQYTIYALDLPGFGDSPLPIRLSLRAGSNPPHKGEEIKYGMSVGDYAEIVKAFIEKLALKNVIIVGHSFGGRVGIKLCAMSNLPNPFPPLKIRGGQGVILKLVLVDSAGFVTSAWKKNLMGVVAKIIKPIFKPGFMQGLRKKIYHSLGAEDYLALPALKETFLKVVNEDLSKDMKDITIPTLIITGEDDKDTPIAFGKRMNFLIPNSQLLILKNAGHYSFLDQPEEFVKILAKFI